MRGGTAAAPSPEALRAMMAAAAAAASAAAGDAAAAAALSVADTPRSTRVHVHRPSANRRQSISMLPALLGSTVEPLSKNAPLPSVQSGARWERLNSVAREIATKWTHPHGSSQYESDTLHLVRAILYMNKSLITQSFVSHVSGVSQGSLSHYVRGLFRGNQKNIEDRLNVFVQKFADGSLDQFLEEARSGSRALSRPSAAYVPTSTPPQQVAQLSMTPAPATNFAESEPVTAARPPVPPPPPPQLQPAPWAKPIPQKEAPVQLAPQHIKLPPPPAPTPVPIATPPKPRALSTPAVLTERARRAQQRQARAKRPRPAFPKFEEDKKELTPTVAVEQAYHTLVASKWTGDHNEAEPLLIPIELFVQQEGRILHTYTQWDVNERILSPEVVADQIRLSRGLPADFTEPAAMQIRRCLFEAGVICPPPPSAEPEENRRLIKIVVEFNEGKTVQVLRDEFEWDLASGCMNSPELFAQSLCTDAKIPQKHAVTVAGAIRTQLSRAHAIAYGDQETKRLALQGLAEDDPLRKELPLVTSALSRSSPEDQIARQREDNEIAVSNLFVKPLLEDVYAEAERRKEERARTISEDIERKELHDLRLKESAEAAAQRAKAEMALKAVDEKAQALREAEGIDFPKYLSFRLGRGERPSVWIPVALERKKRGEDPVPMAEPKKPPAPENRFSRFAKRKRTAKSKDDRNVSRKTHANESAGVRENTENQPPVTAGSDEKVTLVLRIRAPLSKENREKRREKKRRRRSAQGS